jgi:hypothetical protein
MDSQTSRGLRSRALTVDASDLQLAPVVDREHVWGVIMETGYPTASVEAHVDDFTAVTETPLPEVGRVRFYVRTFTGTLGADALEDDLGEGRHALSPVFHAAHSVIAAIRESTPIT